MLSVFLFPAMKIPSNIDATDQKKTKTKLKKFLTRRPTLQAVREKGYIKGKWTFLTKEIIWETEFDDSCVKWGSCCLVLE